MEPLHSIKKCPHPVQDHSSEDEDEDKYVDDFDMPGQNFDSKRRITVRNLRIREDIAKVKITRNLANRCMLIEDMTLFVFCKKKIGS